MKNTKLLKAYCKLTDQHFCFEMAKIDSSWKAVNMIYISEKESKMICSEIKQHEYYSHTNLLPCQSCGNRKLGGCNCSKKNHKCSKDMSYQFDCAYCSELSWDYQRNYFKNNPYNQWAGISNIPNAIKDKYGNPFGSEYDLAKDNAFIGYKIVILCLCTPSNCTLNKVKLSLEKKGFDVVLFLHNNIPTPDNLNTALINASQLWIISDLKLSLNEYHYNVIKKFFNSGHGLYIWGDNDPFNIDANFIIGRLFDSHLSGDYYGDQVLHIQKKRNKPGIIPNHLISTGLVSFYEGITISKVSLSKCLHPLIYSSDSNIVATFYEQDGKRAIIDGGFTRLRDDFWHKTAGTERYVVNAACWLANAEKYLLE